MERIESTHSIWLFDVERMRFRRVPKGSDPNAPSLDSDWEPYFALDVDNETGAFTVALNEDRTRLLRAWRDDVPAVPLSRGSFILSFVLSSARTCAVLCTQL